MALINNLYIFVTSENIARGIESPTHATEKGLPLTDHVKRNPLELSIDGHIVGENYKKTIDQIYEWQRTGKLIKYVGNVSFSNAIITSFDTDHPNTINDVQFSMSIKEIRIAEKPVYTTVTVKKKAPTQQVQKNNTSNNVYHTVKGGDTIWGLCVDGPYKNLKPTYSAPMEKCNWVMSQNQGAFSRKGDFRTLQIGEKILVGYKN